MCLLVLGGVYLVGGVAAVVGFFHMRAGPADLAGWLSSMGLPPSGFLVTGSLYCAAGSTGIGAAWALRENSSRGRLCASVCVLLIALDILIKVLRDRVTGLSAEHLFETAVTGALLLMIGIHLVQSRRRL